MQVSRQFKRSALAVLFTGFFWSFIALLFSFATFLMSFQSGEDHYLGIPDSFLFEIVCISPWAVSTPLIFWLARRYHFNKPGRWVSACVHLIAALAVFSFHSLVQSYAVSVFYDEAFTWSYIKIDFVGFADMRVLLYAGLMLGVYTFDYYQKNKDSKLEEPHLRAELNRLNFQNILNHVQPGFLIHSLDNIKQNLKTSPRQAEKNLNEIGTLLRMMLQNLNREEMTVREDQEFLNLYLDIAEKRMDKKIRRIEKIERGCYDAYIPSFLFIMPFLEEMMKSDHDYNVDFKIFTTEASVVDGILWLEGFIEEVDLSEEDLDRIKRTIGMEEIVTRLQNAYGTDVQLEALLMERKICICLSLPYKTGDPATGNDHHEIFGDARKH